MTVKTIKVDYLARVEGEGALHVNINGTTVEDVRLEIFEPPRFFEAFLQGRHFEEVPDIVARICGICPVAYQMSAVHALEDALGVEVNGPTRDLRRLLYCGEWIESHVLHIYMLHAPDFLGYEGSLEMAKDYPEVVTRGLQLKKAGNLLIRVLGGREIHPINIKVGGFYKAPAVAEIRGLREPMLRARDAAIETIRWAARFDFPDLEQNYEFVAMQHDDEYPMNEGRIVSSAGLNIQASDYEDYFEEIQVAHSTALHSRIRGRGAYFVGPMARFNLNQSQLGSVAGEFVNELGLNTPCCNPFKSILIRAIEVLYACEEALRLIDRYERPEAASVDVDIKAASGFWCTEAPRGILFHRYDLADDGQINLARIVPPTSQNQPTIEQDLRDVIERNLSLPERELQHLCEQTVRNYDPCISCATHFLNLNVQRR